MERYDRKKDMIEKKDIIEKKDMLEKKAMIEKKDKDVQKRIQICTKEKYECGQIRWTDKYVD